MVGKEDLGLNLSLGFSQKDENSNHNSVQLNLMPSFLNNHQRSSMASCNNNTFPSSDSNTCRGDETRSFLRGIDVNRLADCEEEASLSSPNSTLSSVSGKRSEREGLGEELEMERECSRSISDEEDGDLSRKKLRLSKDQSATLEDSFKEHNTLNPKQKMALAKQLGLRPRQVEVWFQNRRARTKLKQTEVDCEFLKRCCENLTDENRRLQKEVQELRALKHSPQFYMQMSPPTTLTMCPSCERVAAPPAPLSSTSPAHVTRPVQNRPVMINPWAINPGPHRPVAFNALHHPRS